MKAFVETSDVQAVSQYRTITALRKSDEAHNIRDRAPNMLVYVVPRLKVGRVTKIWSEGIVEVEMPSSKDVPINMFKWNEVVDM